MGNTAPENPTADDRERASLASVLLPPLLLLGAVFMAADFTSIHLRPLKALRIPYPRVLDAAHLLIPAACAVLWLGTLRRWPRAGPIVAVVLCFTVISLIPVYAERRVARVPVTRWIDTGELGSMEARLGVPLWEQGTGEGAFVIVAPENERQVRAELSRLGLLRPRAAD
jgi:hypothetical protein